jgi:hypothetical protein
MSRPQLDWDEFLPPPSTSGDIKPKDWTTFARQCRAKLGEYSFVVGIMPDGREIPIIGPNPKRVLLFHQDKRARGPNLVMIRVDDDDDLSC